MIYLVEGADGTGKTTLAKAIEKHVEGTVIHSGLRSRETVEEYHRRIYTAALWLDAHGVPVVLDRWAPSEHVYGAVFRGGAAYNTDALMMGQMFMESAACLIYCRNDDAAANHRRNAEVRDEYHGDITEVVAEYERYVADRDWGWLTYDYSKASLNRFLKELPT